MPPQAVSSIAQNVKSRFIKSYATIPQEQFADLRVNLLHTVRLLSRNLVKTLQSHAELQLCIPFTIQALMGRATSRPAGLVQIFPLRIYGNGSSTRASF